MSVLVRQRRVVVSRFRKRGKRRHLDVVGAGCILSAIPAVANVSPDGPEPRLRTFDAFGCRDGWFGFGNVAVNLRRVEN